MDELDPVTGAAPEGDALDQALSALTPLPASQQVEASPITASSRPREASGGGDAPQRDPGSLAAGIVGAADAVTFGFFDEITSPLAAIVPGSDRETVWNSSKSFSAILSSNIAATRAKQKRLAEQHQVATVVGGIGGGLLVPFGASARGALQVAKVGAVQGLVYGVGSGEGVEDRAVKGVEGAGLGAVVGAALGRYLPGLKKPKVGEEVAEGVVGASTTTSYSTRATDEAATIAGPDGTVYARQLPDGQVLAQFDEAGQPVYTTGLEIDLTGDIPSRSLADLTPVERARLDADMEKSQEPFIYDETVGDWRNETLEERTLRHSEIDRRLGADASSIRPQVVDEPAIPLEAPPLTPEGAPTPVGSIGRTELTAFQDDVARFRNDPNLPPDAPQGQWSIGSLGEGQDAVGLLSALARQLPASVRKTDQELAQTASDIAGSIGEDPEAMLAWARQAAGSIGDVDNTMMALRSVWAKMGEQVNAFHVSGVDWSQADDSLVLSAGQAIRNLSELSQQVQTAKVGLGRGLRVNQLPSSDDYLKLLLGKADEAAEEGAEAAGKTTPPVPPREAPPLPRNRKELEDWFELWGMHKDNPKGQADFLQGLLTVPTPGKYLRTSFANFFTASILSAPRTIAMNIVGPSFLSVIRNAERFGGAAAGALNPFSTAEQRAAMRAVARETPIAYMRTLGDIGDAFRYGLQAAEGNRSVIGGGSSSSDALSTYGPLTNNLLGAAGADPNMMYSLGNLINVFPKAFARLNNGLDETAKRLAYMGEARVRAQVEASQKGLEGNALHDFVREKLAKSFDAVGHASDQDLLRTAERTTLTSQVGEEGSFVRSFSNQVQALRRDIPEVRYLVPVFNVPANALGETLRRIPLANRMLSVHSADLAGENGVVAQAEAHGRTLLGASFLMAGVMLNRSGLLTGAGPQEATDRKVWLQTHQPYSIRVGDTWVRYDKVDLLGGLLSIPATISDASTYRAADQGIGDMMSAGAGALAQWFKDKAALRTASALLNAGSDPTSDFGSLISQTLASTAAGFIPAAARTTLVDPLDPYVRMRRDWTDYIKASLPGLSQTLEPTRNVLGEPIQRAADTFEEALFPVTMQSAVTFKDDPVMDELARIYETTGYGAGADPKSLGYGFFNPKDVKLEDGRSLYDRAMQKRMVMEVDGKDLRATLRELFDSAEYNNAVDADSSQRVTSLGDASRGYLTRQVFDKFNKAAKAELANESPAAASYLTAAAAKQRDDAYLRDVSAEDLVKTPRLYQDRGINAQAYTDKIKSGGGSSDPLAAALGL